jgi:ketosteroid isomerase-like protein
MGEAQMAGNADTAKKAYEDFANGDVQAATENWAEDIVWQGPNSTEVPGGGEHSGKDAALETLGDAVGAWDEFVLHMDEFLEKGDTVVALGHSHVKKGDNEAQAPVVHILRFEEGKVKRFQILTDTLQGAKMLGIV